MADEEFTLRSRAESKSLGLPRYFTGKPCKHAHVAERHTVNGSCVECVLIRTRAKYRADPAADLARQKVWREANPDYVQAKKARRHSTDPDLAMRVALRAEDEAARTRAADAGCSTYLAKRACAYGHAALRFTNDNHCVECNRLACLARHHSTPEYRANQATKAQRRDERAAHTARIEPLRQVREARRIAQESGALTYEGRPCKHGHGTTRYTCGGCCVACAALRAASPEKAAYDKAYGILNRDRIKARYDEYRMRNAEMLADARKKWVLANPDRIGVIKAAYKARRRQQEAGGDSTAAIYEWERVAPKVCYWCSCKTPKSYHVDHYVPLSKGGKHEVSNLVIACPPCNLKKSAKDPYEFARQVGRLF